MRYGKKPIEIADMGGGGSRRFMLCIFMRRTAHTVAGLRGGIGHGQ